MNKDFMEIFFPKDLTKANYGFSHPCTDWLGDRFAFGRIEKRYFTTEKATHKKVYSYKWVTCSWKKDVDVCRRCISYFPVLRSNYDIIRTLNSQYGEKVNSIRIIQNEK